jgi:hypothetical protein
MAIIQDAASGVTAKVDAANRMLVQSVSRAEDRQANINGDYYSAYFQVTPAGANDYFFYLRNDGVEDIVVTDFRMSSTALTRLLIHRVVGTPVFSDTNTTIVTSRNLGSSKAPIITARDDTDITGLTSEGVLFFEDMSAVDTLFDLRSQSTIIIPQGQAIALQRVGATGTQTVDVSIAKTDIT